MTYDVKSTREGWHRYFPVITKDKAGDAYAIEYRSIKGLFPNREPVVVQSVVFDRWNNAAGVSERVMVTWQQAFQWADHDPCGGVVKGVFLGNDRYEHAWQYAHAESRWFNHDYHRTPIGSDGNRKYGLCGITFQGDGGDYIMERDYDISRELADGNYHVQTATVPGHIRNF